MNRYWIYIFLLLILSGASCMKQTPHPNVILIMADDLGYGDLGCYGATKIRTPHIDRLAKNGIMFLDAHSPASVCTPTRYGVLTGRYSWRGHLKNGILWSGYEPCLVEEGRKTIGNMMQEAGYKTAYIGKWHLGWGNDKPVNYDTVLLGRGPRDLGFDFSFVTAATQNLSPITFVEDHMIMSKLVPLEHELYCPTKGGIIPENEARSHTAQEPGPPMIAGDWQPDRVDQIFAQRAIDFITRHVMTDSVHPFFVHFAPEAPHHPNNVPSFMKQTSNAGIRGDHIQMLDWIVQQITTTIMELGVEQNTLLILTSDNGPWPAGIDGYEDGRLVTDFGHESASDLRGFKGSNWEGGHRVPFIAYWPGKIAPGMQSEKLICLTDIMATFAEITGYKLDSNMGEDSYNILPIFLGEQVDIRESIIHQDFEGNLAIRQGYWKLIGGELYNLNDDPGETHDLAAEYPAKVDELNKLLQENITQGRSTFRAMEGGRPLDIAGKYISGCIFHKPNVL